MIQLFKLLLIAALFSVSLKIHAANYNVVTKQVGAVGIPFVHNAIADEKVYHQKASFVEIEKLAPLRTEQMLPVKPSDLRTLSLEEFNQIYARINA